MRCLYCNKNEATKTYEQVKKDKKSTEYYCLDCYHRLFLSAEETGVENSLSACPYCGTALSEYETTKLVGCAYCYRTMQTGLTPSIVKMQGGVSGHRGKMPPLSPDDEELLDDKQFATAAELDAFRIDAAKRARVERQCAEMEILSDYLRDKKDYDGADGYEAKLAKMRITSEVEEEFVWRTGRALTKQS